MIDTEMDMNIRLNMLSLSSMNIHRNELEDWVNCNVGTTKKDLLRFQQYLVELASACDQLYTIAERSAAVDPQIIINLLKPILPRQVKDDGK